MAIGTQDKEQKQQPNLAGAHLDTTPKKSAQVTKHYNNIGAGSTKESGRVPDAPGGGILSKMSAMFSGVNPNMYMQDGAFQTVLNGLPNQQNGTPQRNTPQRDMSPEEFNRRLANTPRPQEVLIPPRNVAAEGSTQPQGAPVRRPDAAGANVTDDVGYLQAAIDARGDKITVGKGTNGEVTFSGMGTARTPQAMNPAASGNINMQAGNDAYARALAIRQSMNGGSAGAGNNFMGANMAGLPQQREVVGIEAPKDTSARDALIRAARTPMPGAQNGQLTAAQRRDLNTLLEGERKDAMQQAQNTQQAQQNAMNNAIALQRLGVEQGRANIEQAKYGQEIQNLARQQAAQDAVLNAKTPEERAFAMKSLYAMQGKTDPETELVQGIIQSYAKGAAGNELGGGASLPEIVAQARAAMGYGQLPAGAQPAAAQQTQIAKDGATIGNPETGEMWRNKNGQWEQVR